MLALNNRSGLPRLVVALTIVASLVVTGCDSNPGAPGVVKPATESTGPAPAPPPPKTGADKAKMKSKQVRGSGANSSA